MEPPHISAPSAEPETTLIFVYGSLKRGFRNHGELEGASFEGVARTIAEFQLVLFGEYPALTAGERSVSGELYRVDRATLARLDEFEGDGYERCVIELDDGRTADVYLIASGGLGAAFEGDEWSE